MNISLGFMRHNINPIVDRPFIDYAINHGINSFETCEFYMNKQCEQYVYSLLDQYSRNLYVIYGKMPKYIIRQEKYKEVFNQQIKKVPQGFFDYYMLQALDETSLYYLLHTDIIQFFQEQKRNGLIKSVGVSVQCTPDVTKTILKLYEWDFIQLQLNYFDWYLCQADQNYQLAIEQNLPIIAQAPLKGGLLKDYQEAYSFVANLEGVTTVLCGNTTITTLKQTQTFLNNPIKMDEQYYINQIQKYRQDNFIKCLGCNKCSELCSSHLPLMSLIQLHNRGLVDTKCFHDFVLLKHSLGNEPTNICQLCNSCKKVCPLSLDIPFLLEHQIFELRS